MGEEIPMKEHEGGSVESTERRESTALGCFLSSANSEHRSAEQRTRVRDRYNRTSFVV